MNNLTQLNCVACRGGDPKLTDSEIVDLQEQIQNWQLKEIEGILRLEKVYKCKNFVEALAFVNKIGELAEQEDHHPLIVLEWGRVTVQWWTHVVKGLHKNDFIMAAKTDESFKHQHAEQ